MNAAMDPGIFPEPSDPRRSALKGILACVLISLLLLLGYAGLQMRRLARERDHERARVDELVALLRKSPSPSISSGTSSAAGGLGPEARGGTALPSDVSPSPSSARAPDVRVLPPTAREVVEERLRLGMADLRAGRHPQAELHFFRALPDGYPYLVLTSLGRGDYAEAASFLARAAAADPAWFRALRPRDLLAEADYARLLAALEARVRENPLDAGAKTLLAYLHFHEKGPAYAKALLIEVTTLQPDNAEARQFLEALDK